MWDNIISEFTLWYLDDSCRSNVTFQFLSFLSFKMACFPPKDSSHVGLSFLTQMQFSQTRLKPRVDIQNQSIYQDTSGQQETPASYMFQYFCSQQIGRSDTNGALAEVKIKLPGNKSWNSDPSSHVHLLTSNSIVLSKNKGIDPAVPILLEGTVLKSKLLSAQWHYCTWIKIDFGDISQRPIKKVYCES